MNVINEVLIVLNISQAFSGCAVGTTIVVELWYCLAIIIVFEFEWFAGNLFDIHDAMYCFWRLRKTGLYKHPNVSFALKRY